MATASVGSEGSFDRIRNATAHVDSDSLRSSRGNASLPFRKPELAIDMSTGQTDPSGLAASETPVSVLSNSESSSITAADGDDRLQRMAAACKVLLECLGEDPEREGLMKTPMRMAKSLVACTAGYSQEPAAIVSDALFSCDSDDMVVVRDIDCYSMCEHHMLPFMGKVHIGYLPSGRVVGLSKLARLTDCFAKRLQIQERLTRQIADAVQECTGARGVAVMVEATHMCMAMRGVEKPGAMTQTSSFTGVFKESRDMRAEFTAAVRVGGAPHR